MKKTSVLFVCTGNSCRSQMAEAWLRHLAGDRIDAVSAGSHAAGYVHALAIEAMRDAGLDISAYRSKGLDEVAERRFDYVVTVCDHAKQHCAAFAGNVDTLHWSIPDPVLQKGTAEEVLAFAVRVRDDLRKRVEKLIRKIDKETKE